MRSWLAKRGGKALLPGEKAWRCPINRRDVISIPVPAANLLWHDLHTRNVQKVETNDKPTTRTENVRVDVIVDGITNDNAWQCGFEFDYQNEESFVCRPVRLPGYEQSKS